MKLQCLCLCVGSCARSAAVRLHGIGGSCQERFCGTPIAEVSGLVAGVDIGVNLTEPGGVGEELATSGKLMCGSSLSTDDVERSITGSASFSSLPSSTP